MTLYILNLNFHYVLDIMHFYSCSMEIINLNIQFNQIRLLKTIIFIYFHLILF